MKQVFLSPVRIETHLEKTISGTEMKEIDEVLGHSEASSDTCNDGFNDFDYPVDYEDIQEVKNTDAYDKYTISSEHYMTLKEARISKEIRTSFAIIKYRGKKGKATDYDNIYRTDKKIKYKQYRQRVRLGFIRGARDFRYSNIKLHYDLSPDKSIVGILNEEIPIRKKKGFNQKTVGFIKLSEAADYEDYYVEVTRSRGILWMILTALIVIALALLLSRHDWSSWHFDWNSLTAYKTEVSEVQTENLMEISHRAEVDLEGSSLRLELTSNQTVATEYKVKIYIGEGTSGQQIYESEKLPAGTGLETIEVTGTENLDPGSYTCSIQCEVYKELGGYLGSLESHFTMRK